MTTSSATVVRSMDNSPVSQDVIYAVAEATDTDPMEMAPMHEVVDLEALDRLFRSGSGRSPSTRIDFTANGCEVTVHASGEVSATPLSD